MSGSDSFQNDCRDLCHSPIPYSMAGFGIASSEPDKLRPRSCALLSLTSSLDEPLIDGDFPSLMMGAHGMKGGPFLSLSRQALFLGGGLALGWWIAVSF